MQAGGASRLPFAWRRVPSSKAVRARRLLRMLASWPPCAPPRPHAVHTPHPGRPGGWAVVPGARTSAAARAPCACRGQRQPALEGHGLGHDARAGQRHGGLHLALFLQQLRPGLPGGWVGGVHRGHPTAAAVWAWLRQRVLPACGSAPRGGAQPPAREASHRIAHPARGELLESPVLLGSGQHAPSCYAPPPRRHAWGARMHVVHPAAPRRALQVAVQAALTVIGNCTCWLAAYRLFAAAQDERQQA